MDLTTNGVVGFRRDQICSRSNGSPKQVREKLSRKITQDNKTKEEEEHRVTEDQ